jgi:hypothetical protein
VVTKIVFLDFDGVLVPDVDAQQQTNSGLTHANYLSTVAFNPICVGNLNQLLHTTHAEVVLSTSWAKGHSISQLSNCLMRNGIDPSNIFEYDDPSENSYMTPRNKAYNRGEEIGAWLRAHPEITQWVAIDDDSTVLHLRTNFVRTNPRAGFDAASLQKALKILT